MSTPGQHRPNRARTRVRTLVLALALPTASPAADRAYPPAIQTAVERGMEIEAEFTAPGGLTAYVGRAQDRPIVLYLTPDGEHVIVGTMRDALGRNLTREQIAEYLPPPDLSRVWSLLAGATWVAEGPKAARRVVYVVTDPNCPYCHAFWRKARSYLERGIELRHVLVSVIAPSSLGKAAAILAAEDPAAALARQVRDYETGGIAALNPAPPGLRRRVERNNRLMERLSVQVTPAVFYRDADGRVQRIVGLPDAAALDEHVFRAPST